MHQAFGRVGAAFVDTSKLLCDSWLVKGPLMEALRQKAFASLQENLQPTRQGRFFVAGGHQFRTLWVRDFCYSVPGLIHGGYVDVVANQLRLIKSHVASNGFLPRGLDVINPKTRVVWNSFLPAFAFPKSYTKNKLKPEFLGEHQTPAFDSNLLFIKACCQLAALTQQPFLITRTEVADLLKVYRFNSDGLIEQPAYSDWQDSVRREGVLLLTQLLYLEVCALLRTFEISLIPEATLQKLERQITDKFFSNDLFHEQVDSERLSLDSHLLFLASENILPHISKKNVFAALTKTKLWQMDLSPGVPVHPFYDSKNISWTTKMVGLRHYHDGFYWGWLIADCYRVAKLMGDTKEAEYIANKFAESICGDAFMAEIYEVNHGLLRPVKRRLYKSESPFTWTSAKWLEALA